MGETRKSQRAGDLDSKIAKLKEAKEWKIPSPSFSYSQLQAPQKPFHGIEGLSWTMWDGAGDRLQKEDNMKNLPFVNFCIFLLKM